MVTLNYTINDDLGIHARPAGIIVRQAKNSKSQVFLRKGDKQVNASNILGIMGLGVKKGETVQICAEGPDETEAAQNMLNLFKENL
ncbi:MAG: HPr family phosphocarrier protein [Clostridiales bacterium]|jgi:phosphocarrier protein|nr:HPr family phosphocarrier protein [Clostridiales bacterium]